MIHLIDYDTNHFKIIDLKSIEETFPYINASTVTWIKVMNFLDESFLKSISTYFNFHTDVLDAIKETKQESFVTSYDDYIFISFSLLNNDEFSGISIPYRISLILGAGYLFTFQITGEDIFNGSDKFLEFNREVRMRDADYLLYFLLNLLVGKYNIHLKDIKEKLSKWWDLAAKKRSVFHGNVADLKKELSILSKNLNSISEVISSIMGEDSFLIKESTRKCLHALYKRLNLFLSEIRLLMDSISSLFIFSVSHNLHKFERKINLLLFLTFIILSLLCIFLLFT